jgi:hypothetical protein
VLPSDDGHGSGYDPVHAVELVQLELTIGDAIPCWRASVYEPAADVSTVTNEADANAANCNIAVVYV